MEVKVLRRRLQLCGDRQEALHEALMPTYGSANAGFKDLMKENLFFVELGPFLTDSNVIMTTHMRVTC